MAEIIGHYDSLGNYLCIGRGAGVDWTRSIKADLLGPQAGRNSQKRGIVRGVSVIPRLGERDGTAIEFNGDWNERFHRGVEIDDVSIGGVDPGHNRWFKHGINLNACWNASISNTRIRGHEGVPQGKAIHLHDCIDANLSKVASVFFNLGLLTTGRNEGIRNEQFLAIQCNFGWRMDSRGGSYIPVGNQLLGGHMNTLYRGVEAIGIQQFHIGDTLLYRSDMSDSSRAYVAVDLQKCNNGAMEGVNVIDTLGQPNAHGLVMNRTTNMTISDNRADSVSLGYWDQSDNWDTHKFDNNSGSMR